MKRAAWLFPGQGAQSVGMGRDLHDAYGCVRDTLAAASEALGEDLAGLCFTGPEEKLTLTENAQPALLALSVAVARTLEAEAGLRPVIATGHSLGEWSALVVAGALDLGEAVRAVRMRGRFMQEAAPPGAGAMTALLGADLEAVEDLCKSASRSPRGSDAGSAEVVVPANLNGAGQIVVAGHTPAVERLEQLAKERRVRAMRLRVSAPFHSPLMRPARERMQAVLADLAIAEPGFPVVSNVDGRAEGGCERIRRLLAEQITAPVRWQDCARAVAAQAEIAVEVGPGRTLTGLMRRIAPDLACQPTADLAGVRAAIEEMSR